MKIRLFFIVFIFFSFNFIHSASLNFTRDESAKLRQFSKISLSYNRQKSLHGTVIVPPRYPLIERFRNQYLTENGLRYLEAIMQRSIPYRNFIIQELRRENLPPELLFLPVIESGFSPKAVSKSGAVGIWQFMRNSIGGYDIHIDEWMDERRDPWKTSAAAVKKLKWNYNYYNDWYLALAAYNCGVGALDKAIKKAGSRNYWYLAEKKFLKPETSLYVAKFLAIAEILMNSEKYGIDWGEALDYEATELIPIKRSVDIILLAEKVKADTDLFSALNPSLKFNITPPNVKYNLRIPMEHKEAVQDLLAKNTLLIKYYSYKIRSGDTLYALSRHYGVSIKSIINYNPGIKASALRIGQVLRIPALKTVNSYRRKKDDQNVEFNGVYIIQKGDTLWSIALKHDVQVETLAAKNGIEVNSVLSLGQKLKVPIIN
ncbi:transglycosylase SLT domain-containing protein [Treponema sp. OMZ 792]|uniref:LysM peptidoglycan-binding domain-containing protein n=1 Tax=unclassified Treponema TaxID=2638727 RepID=UPI0020A29B3F|nr:transglycosylase SLT domain-containing protein [Treponema sp. OMZ 798]UTC75689.1 transglycosylase SLT domain-containing protein [Treponema sp. OMZ 792]UTC79688.1 transglycosylase SLT domain-containing protein [Treponema sp. OMZ 798]